MPRIRFDFGSTLLALWISYVVLPSEYLPVLWAYAVLGFLGCLVEASLIGPESYVRVHFAFSYILPRSDNKNRTSLAWLLGALGHFAILIGTLLLLLVLWQMPPFHSQEAERLLIAKLILGNAILLAVQVLPQESTLLGRLIRAISELLQRNLLEQQQLEGFLTLSVAVTWCFVAIKFNSLQLSIFCIFLTLLSCYSLLVTQNLIEFRQDKTGRALYRLLNESQKAVFCGRIVPPNWTIADFKNHFRPTGNEKIAFIAQSPSDAIASNDPEVCYVGIREVEDLAQSKDTSLLKTCPVSHQAPTCRIEAPLKTIETQIIDAPEQEIILVNDHDVPVMIVTRRLLEALYNSV